MMKQFDHMIERKLNLELSNVFPRLKFLTGCGQFSDFSNKVVENVLKAFLKAMTNYHASDTCWEDGDRGTTFLLKLYTSVLT